MTSLSWVNDTSFEETCRSWVHRQQNGYVDWADYVRFRKAVRVMDKQGTPCDCKEYLKTGKCFHDLGSSIASGEFQVDPRAKTISDGPRPPGRPKNVGSSWDRDTA